MHETSLLIFSFCLQAAIGMMFFITLGKQLHKDKLFKEASLVAAALSVVGVLASLLHLGQPARFLNSLSNLGNSWLSNEAFLCGVFAGIAVLYALVQYIKPESKGLNTILRWGGSIIGLVAVFSMGKLYSTTIVPVWQGMNTFVDFYATTVAVGALLFIVTSLKELAGTNKRIYGLIVLAAVIIQAAVAFPHALNLGSEGMAAQASAAILANMSGVIGLKWLLVLGGAGLLLWPTSSGGKAEVKSYTGLLYAACASLVIGELIGRYVFYAAIVGLNIGVI